MIDAVTGKPFTARVTGFPLGATGTVAYAVLDANDTAIVARTTSGVTADNDSPGDYLASVTIATAGAYRIVWDYGTDVTATEDIDVEGLSYSPSVADVAALVPSRPRNEYGRLETFDDTTQPTANQVVDLISVATRRVEQRMGDTVPDALAEAAKQTIALRAALLVELTYFGDQISSDRSPYTQLRDLEKEAFAELLQAWANLGADQEPGTDDDLEPIYWFPPSCEAGPIW